MSIYLGQLGRLVELRGPSSQSHGVDDGYTFERTLEGRVKAQTRPLRRRQWSVNISTATPFDIGNLFAFSAGEWGIGPFVWVSTDAPVTNMLTPAAASCDPSAISDPSSANFNSGVTAAGAMVLDDGGVAGRTWTVDGDFMFFGYNRVPVLPGQPVTGSAYVMGEGAVARLTFYGPDNLAIGNTVSSTVAATAGTVVRSHVTATPPAGAVGCLVSAAYATQAARPALTWTDRLFDWADGAGCPKAVIHGLSRDVVLALREPNYGRYANASFTVQEVG